MVGKLFSHLRRQWIGALTLLLVLTGGTAYALEGSNTVFSDDLVDGEVTNRDLAANSVGSGKLSDGGVKNADLGPGASASNTIADGGVRSIDIGNGQVTGPDVLDDSLIGDDIDDIISSGGVTQIDLGGEKTLLRDGPFTIAATCAQGTLDNNPESLISKVTITSSEEHSVSDLKNFGSGEMSETGRAVRVEFYEAGWAGAHFFAAAPSGATLDGYLGAGVHTLGFDDCTAVATAIGTSLLD